MAGEFQVTGKNTAALFTLKVHRGDGATCTVFASGRD